MLWDFSVDILVGKHFLTRISTRKSHSIIKITLFVPSDVSVGSRHQIIRKRSFSWCCGTLLWIPVNEYAPTPDRIHQKYIFEHRGAYKLMRNHLAQQIQYKCWSKFKKHTMRIAFCWFKFKKERRRPSELLLIQQLTDSMLSEQTFFSQEYQRKSPTAS